MNILVVATANLPRAQTTAALKAPMPHRSSYSSAASRKKQQPSLLLSIPITAMVAGKSPATNNGNSKPISLESRSHRRPTTTAAVNSMNFLWVV